MGLRTPIYGAASTAARAVLLESPQSLLVRLVTGYASVEYIARLRAARIPRQVWPILQALFPKGCPYIWNADIGY